MLYEVITESFSVGSAANYTASLSCSGATDSDPSDGLLIDAADAGNTITCTLTNTRKSASLVLEKVWQNAKLNDAATVSATGLTDLSAVADTVV